MTVLTTTEEVAGPASPVIDPAPVDPAWWVGIRYTPKKRRRWLVCTPPGYGQREFSYRWTQEAAVRRARRLATRESWAYEDRKRDYGVIARPRMFHVVDVQQHPGFS